MSEKVTVRVERNILHLPAIALRGLVVFPNNLLHFEVGREKSIAAVEWAVSNHSNVFLIAQKDMKADDPAADGLYHYGVVAEIKQVMRVSDDLVRILVEGKYRAKLTQIDTDGSFLLAPHAGAPREARRRGRGGCAAPQREKELRRAAQPEPPHRQGCGVRGQFQ